MPPDHDRFNGSVNLDDAASVPWLVPARPQPGSLAGLTADPGSELSFPLVPYHPAGQPRGIT
jgi:hypothetical protein